MTLRDALLTIALLLLGLAMLCTVADGQQWPVVVGTAAFVAILLFERQRYRASIAPDNRLRPTQECFLDPETGRLVRVWEGPDGERHYVEDQVNDR